MIKLQLADYCQDCTKMEPEREVTEAMLSQDLKSVNKGDTIIKCKNEELCRSIARYFDRIYSKKLAQGATHLQIQKLIEKEKKR